ncbi:MAG: hypothetical protein HS111_32440 [Kofleriaceae bacterium]|nr:hypothetical protein [Kofleriaceae bacterium]MCL4226444.1 hypothetical protein [Myxococcales bacterium]
MRMRLGLSLAGLGLGLVGLSNVSCQAIDCGPGTLERDGVCVPADETVGDARCGGAGPFATVLGLDGTCEVETPTQCDPTTTEERFDPQTGITTCVGTGGGCSEPIACQAPDAGRATLCGRIWDTETDTPFAEAVNNATMRCDPANPTQDGPCSLRLRFFDALDFAMNPSGAMPLVPEGGVFQDGCNRYRGHNLPRATFGFIGIAVDDAMGTPARHIMTGVATSNAFASPGRDFRAYITRNSTDTAWTSSAGLAGDSFATRGVLAIVFHYQDAPVSGITVRRNGSLIPNDDFYFSDTDRERTTVDAALTSTGANGTVLVINSPTPIAHDGVGNEPSGCIWPSNLAASIPNVVFVQIKEAETPAGVVCE